MTDKIEITRERLKEVLDDYVVGDECKSAVLASIFGSKKPREFYINFYPSPWRRCLHDTREEAEASSDDQRTECIRVREVLDEK